MNQSELTGPWWSNNTPIDEGVECIPQEAFLRVEFPNAREVSFSIATGCFYQMWFNGVWIGYGPARAPHGRLTIDRWVLPEQHFKDENCITIQAFWEGLFTFDHVRGSPGVWMALDQSGQSVSCQPLASTRTGRAATHRFSHQRGWVEEIDGRHRAAGWPGGPWSESEWQTAVMRTTDAAVTLEARDIQPFVTKTRRPESVTFAGAADLRERTVHRALGYEGQPSFGAPGDSPSRNIQEEALRPSAARDENLAGVTGSGKGATTLHPDPAGLDRTLQLDFGTYVTGMLALEIDAPAGTQIDVGWSEIAWDEELVSRWSSSDQPGGSVAARECADSRQGLRYICRGGGNERLDALFIMALRQMRLTFRMAPDIKGAIVIRDLAVRVAGYPIEREGDFRCSDESLNRIYRAAVETMENSIHDVYLDCPGRERGGWIDGGQAAAGMLAISSDVSFDRRFLRQFIDSMAVIPEMHTVAPLYPSEFHRWAGGQQRPIVCHSLTWMLHAERHLRLYGDERLKQEWWPALQAAAGGMRLFRRADGLIENMVWDDFIDWSSPENGPIRTWTNFIYGLTLTRLGRLYDNANLEREGRQTTETIERAAWNPGRELYADVVRATGETLTPGERFSEVTNYAALWSGSIPREREELVWRQMRNLHPRSTDRPMMLYELDLARCNSFGLIFRFDVTGRRGEIECLVRDLKESFLPMLDRGQTTLAEHLACHFSLCHAFQGYVAHLLACYVGGIQLPEQPGGVIRLRPQPALMSWSQTRTPWMGGHVQIWCSRRGQSEAEVIISLPPGQRGELVMGSQAPVEFVSTLHTRVRFGG